MSLKEELVEWLYSNEDPKYLLENGHVEDFVDLLWEQLQAKIGPVQEKLLSDVEAARVERDQAIGRLEAVAHELSRLQQRDDS